MHKPVRQDWYDEAEAYDVVYDVDADDDARGLLTVARRWLGRPPHRVLEPACGSGRLVRALARRDVAITGFDRNPAMVRYARLSLREEGLRARVVEADMRDFQLGTRFDLAHCLISSFKHLALERDARAHLRCVAASLRRGGLYVLGLHLADYEGRDDDHETWVASRGDLTVTVDLTTRAADRRRRRERMELSLRIDGPDGVRTRRDHWWFRTYDADQLRRLLASVPEFELVDSLDFDFVRRPLDHDRVDRIVVLRRI